MVSSRWLFHKTYTMLKEQRRLVGKLFETAGGNKILFIRKFCFCHSIRFKALSTMSTVNLNHMFVLPPAETSELPKRKQKQEHEWRGRKLPRTWNNNTCTHSDNRILFSQRGESLGWIHLLTKATSMWRIKHDPIRSKSQEQLQANMCQAIHPSPHFNRECSPMS